MISVSKKTKYALGFLGVSLLLAIIIAEWQFNALRTAPPADGSAYVDGANVVVVVQPGRAPHFIQSLAREVSGYSIPMWILNASMPHEIGMSFVEHEDNGEVGIQVYGSLKRFGNTILSMDALSPLNSLEDRINWKPDEMTSPRRGLLLATGSVESDADALDQVFLQWGDSGLLTHKSISGGHLWELLFDNRAGKAYLSMASMMTAFDYKFTEKNMNILLSSIQFVTTLRAYADVSEDDVMTIAIDVDIIPSARNRVGVLNMKGAIDEGFAELGKRLAENNGIRIEGESNWNDMTIEFRYTINHATLFVGQFLTNDGTADR